MVLQAVQRLFWILLAVLAAVLFLVAMKDQGFGSLSQADYASIAFKIVLLAVILPFAGLGALPYGIYLLAALTSITVVQRMLFVRSQLQTTSEG